MEIPINNNFQDTGKHWISQEVFLEQVVEKRIYSHEPHFYRDGPDKSGVTLGRGQERKKKPVGF